MKSEIIILDEEIDVKLNIKNKKHYINKGYTYTKSGEIIKVKIEDLPKNCEALLNVKCPKCGKIHKRTNSSIIKGKNTCCSECSNYVGTIEPCQFCGELTNRKYNGKGICNRHRYQIGRYSRIVKGRYDKNKYIIEGNIVKMELWYKKDIFPQYALFNIEHLEKVKQYNWFPEKVSDDLWYVSTHINGRNLRLHRLIMGDDTDLVIDHINNNGLDNTNSNLRECTIAENSRNIRSRGGSYSRIKGVTYFKKSKKWKAFITYNGNTINIKDCDDLEEARLLRREKEFELFGVYAKPTDWLKKDVYISGFQFDNIVSGEGFRNVCYISGCWWNCNMCHNPESHDKTYGTKYKIKEVIEMLTKDDNEVTISGGDGLTYQVRETYEIIKELKLYHNKNIWVYTGFKYEDLLKNEDPIRQEILKYIDVLVDGKFNYNVADSNLAFKGDPTQRIIDVQESLRQNKIIEMNIN